MSDCNASPPELYLEEESTPMKLNADLRRATASVKAYRSLPRNKSLSQLKTKPPLFLRSYSTPNALDNDSNEIEAEQVCITNALAYCYFLCKIVPQKKLQHLLAFE